MLMFFWVVMARYRLLGEVAMAETVPGLKSWTKNCSIQLTAE